MFELPEPFVGLFDPCRITTRVLSCIVVGKDLRTQMR